LQKLEISKIIIYIREDWLLLNKLLKQLFFYEVTSNIIRAKRITGQILTVDGGRQLTSSGYVHW